MANNKKYFDTIFGNKKIKDGLGTIGKQLKPVVDEVKAYGKVLKPVTDSAKAAEGAGGSALGRVNPWLAGLMTVGSLYDIKRSWDISNAMKEMNKHQPNSFSKDDINYYRNKALTKGGGMTVGGVAGAYAGKSWLPALAGAGIGDLTSSGIYSLVNKGKDHKTMKPEDWEYLEKIAELERNKKENQAKNIAATNKASASKSTGKSSGAINYAPDRGLEQIIYDRTNGNHTMDMPPQIRMVEPQYAGTVSAPSVASEAQATSDISVPNESTQNLLLQYQKMREGNNLYLDKLKEYIDNYDKLREASLRNDIYFRGLAGWSGNNSLANLGDKYNPVNLEAQKLALYKQLANDNINNEEDLLRLQGDIKLMEEMGMDPSTAFANPKTLTNMFNMAKVQQQIQARKEIANLNAQVKRLDMEYKLAMAQGRREDAFKLQALKEQANVKLAAINGIGFGADPATIYGAMNALGYSAPAYYEQQSPDIYDIEQ